MLFFPFDFFELIKFFIEAKAEIVVEVATRAEIVNAVGIVVATVVVAVVTAATLQAVSLDLTPSPRARVAANPSPIRSLCQRVVPSLGLGKEINRRNLRDQGKLA